MFFEYQGKEQAVIFRFYSLEDRGKGKRRFPTFIPLKTLGEQDFLDTLGEQGTWMSDNLPFCHLARLNYDQRRKREGDKFPLERQRLRGT